MRTPDLIYCRYCGTWHDVTKVGMLCPVTLLPLTKTEEEREAKTSGTGDVAVGDNHKGSSTDTAVGKEGDDAFCFRICSACGYKNPPDAGKCKFCGAFLDDPYVDESNAKEFHMIPPVRGTEAPSDNGKHLAFIVSTDHRVKVSLSEGQNLLFCPTDGTELGNYLMDRPFVSGAGTKGRCHAVIHANGETLTLFDCKSTNGTYVNGSRILASGRILRKGDLIGLGSSRTVMSEATGKAAFFLVDE